jgi:hypothetical protein
MAYFIPIQSNDTNILGLMTGSSSTSPLPTMSNGVHRYEGAIITPEQHRAAGSITRSTRDSSHLSYRQDTPSNLYSPFPSSHKYYNGHELTPQSSPLRLLTPVHLFCGPTPNSSNINNFNKHSPSRSTGIISAWTLPSDVPEASKYRQLPCKTFVSVGACPYRDRCKYTSFSLPVPIYA